MKRNNLKISIIMPCFNTVEYIERTIKSVVKQDYSNKELFIKDGGSTDGTVEIIKHYALKYPKVIKWVSKTDNGQTDAINYGMKRVDGEVLTYLNSDDLYKSGALSTIAEYFLKHPDVMWAYGKADIIDRDDKPMRGWITSYKNFWLAHYSFTTLLILNYISQMSCFWRKEAYKKVGEFDIKQHYVMDYDYWLRLGEKYGAGVINKYLASFRLVSTTKSTTGFLKQFNDEYEVAKKHTNSQVIRNLHFIHYQLIILIYSFLRLINSFRGYLG